MKNLPRFGIIWFRNSEKHNKWISKHLYDALFYMDIEIWELLHVLR